MNQSHIIYADYKIHHNRSELQIIIMITEILRTLTNKFSIFLLNSSRITI